jgi:hypothetical protein
MLREARSQGEALELSEITLAGSSQYGARFDEMRARGLEVINELQHVDGIAQYRYLLSFDPAQGGEQ